MSKNKPINIILNGDDFGYSPGVNRGITEAIDNGILTSTSVMVHRVAANEAVKLVSNKNISIGLHLDMTEEGLRRWLGLAVMFFKPSKRIEREFMAQIDAFVSITGQLPHHIDGHHNVHMHPRVKPYVKRFSKEHHIPLRGDGSAKFVMNFFGRSLKHWNDPQKVSAAHLMSIIKAFTPGTYEIMCHPGYVDDDLLQTRTTYLTQRTREVEALTDKHVKDFLKDRPDIGVIDWRHV